MENRSFYNEILTEHNVHPEYKHDLPDADIVLNGVNPSCGDDIWLKLKTDGDVITDGAFIGDGCAICCQIAVCRNVLKKLSLSVCAAAFAAAFTYTLCREFLTCADCIHYNSLVALKVKLSD